MISALLSLALTATSSDSSSTNRPHILYMVLDDLGWADIGSHGSDFPTPVMDKVMTESIELTRYYVQPVCSPTRSALVTGRYPFNMGLQHINTIAPGSTAHVPLDAMTVAEMVKGQGYATHMVGKWHLGYASWDYTPTGRGFDTFTGYMQGMIDYYTREFQQGYDFWQGTKADYRHTGNYTLTDYLTDSETVLRKTVEEGRPSFLYFAHQNIHIPLDEPPTTNPKCDGVTPDRRRTLCDMMSALDTAVGTTLQLYRDLGIWNNTLVVMTTDNGGMTAFTENFPGSASSNWPLRGGKTTLFEGGVRGVGLVTGGEGVFPETLRGTKYANLAHAADLVPTILEAAGMGGVAKELDLDGVSHWGWMTSQNATAPPRTEVPVNIIFGGHNFTSIISKDMKLITGIDQGMYDGYWTVSPYQELPPPADLHNMTRLFNLTADPTEQHNIAEAHPEVVEFLKQRIAFYASGDRYSEPVDNSIHAASLPALHNGTWAPFLP